ncbi:hypothetical protein ACA910_006319 [Epithemia clementina (nom. ined.)]
MAKKKTNRQAKKKLPFSELQWERSRYEWGEEEHYNCKEKKYDEKKLYWDDLDGGYFDDREHHGKQRKQQLRNESKQQRKPKYYTNPRPDREGRGTHSFALDESCYTDISSRKKQQPRSSTSNNDNNNSSRGCDRTMDDDDETTEDHDDIFWKASRYRIDNDNDDDDDEGDDDTSKDKDSDLGQEKNTPMDWANMAAELLLVPIAKGVQQVLRFLTGAVAAAVTTSSS